AHGCTGGGRGHATGAGTPPARARHRRGHATGAGTPPARARHRRGHATGVPLPGPCTRVMRHTRIRTDARAAFGRA
ncbi:MAG: hypothetical protein NZM94_16850, partial [Roseiflexus sp.]|nr:hypothetical protein [Roseiflexus sp.]